MSTFFARWKQPVFSLLALDERLLFGPRGRPRATRRVTTITWIGVKEVMGEKNRVLREHLDNTTIATMDIRLLGHIGKLDDIRTVHLDKLKLFKTPFVPLLHRREIQPPKQP
uniref:Uncharacterized protein n=1 Tax=Panagrellus redivivus TaxID=6233 RepID=A0A7E4VM97_PANRE